MRKLFADIPGLGPEECRNLQQRVLRVYDKRSTLVHQGRLPAAEIPALEREARELLEVLINATLERGKRREDPGTGRDSGMVPPY